MSYLAILGRQPALSLAELESRFGAAAITSLGQSAILTGEPPDINTLGGTLKLANVVAEIPHFEWPAVLDALSAPELISLLPFDGKASIGLSLYGFTIPARTIFAKGLELKKRLRSQGRTIRLVPNEQPDISTAQVLHNSLISKGADWVIVKNGTGALIGKTVAIQDIEAYGKRDHGRPARSAKVGMLPPKLAQIMVNLADAPDGSTVLDPFCGTGVILQEAHLLSYKVYGSDIEAELVEMSRTNLTWLDNKLHPHLEVGDATSHTWTPPIGAVVTEGYLGPALTHEPSAKELPVLQAEATKLSLAFFTNLHAQIKPGTPVVITLPAWKVGPGYQRLEVVDQICKLGYTQGQFKHARQADLLYQREGQIVARELIKLVRN